MKEIVTNLIGCTIESSNYDGQQCTRCFSYAHPSELELIDNPITGAAKVLVHSPGVKGGCR